MLKTFLAFFFVLGSVVFSQSWKSTLNLGISAGSDERIDLYTNAAGNHLLVQSDNLLKYYLYSYNGTLVRSSVIDNLTESKRINSITGGAGKIYVIYKKGNRIKSKRTSNNGLTWSELYDINMTYSVSDGIDAVADDQSVYMVWSERSSSPNHYETNYVRIGHSYSSWTDFKQVTDESGKEGGLPSVTLASDRVSVGFVELSENGEEGSVFLREKVNNNWQNSSFVWYGIESYFINGNNYTHLLTYDFGDTPLPYGEPDYMLSHYFGPIGSTNWPENNYTIIENFGAGNIPDENKRSSATLTKDGNLHVVYNGTIYKKWSGTQFTDTYYFGYGTNNKISANGNDIYIVWIENGNVKLRQRDYAPLTPSGFSGSWTNNDPENGHPRLDWNANNEADLKEYEVWKKVDAYGGGTIEPWAKLASTTETYYIDNSEIGWEMMYNPRVVYYKIRAVDQYNNNSSFTNIVDFYCNDGSHIQDYDSDLPIAALPLKVVLSSNYPNPFNPTTTIKFGLPENGNVILTVYSLTGEKVKTLVNGVYPAGYHTVQWDGTNAANRKTAGGVYIYELKAGGKRVVKKMILTK